MEIRISRAHVRLSRRRRKLIINWGEARARLTAQYPRSTPYIHHDRILENPRVVQDKLAVRHGPHGILEHRLVDIYRDEPTEMEIDR
jgi:hypothetical protein